MTRAATRCARIGVAPCSPFSVSRDLMRDAAALARSYGVSLHTHLAENANDIAYSRERFSCTPAEYADDLGWVGPDVWHAHCVQLDAAGIALFARTGTGVAHCPCSNMRLGSGIAPVRAMRDAGVPVGLGVDGSASNDGGHMLGEARTGAPVAAGWLRPRRDERARGAGDRDAAAARACSAATTSARSRPAWRRISWPSICARSASRARCTIRSRRSCSAPRRRLR